VLLGKVLGMEDGATVGTLLGKTVGESLGSELGIEEGATVGQMLGRIVG